MYYFLTLVLTFFLFLFTLPSSASNRQSLHEASQEVLDSTFTSDLIFNCGDLAFKLTSNLFLTKLYWKSGLDWEILEDVDFKDAGFIFTGLGSPNGAPIRSMNIDVDLPILKKSKKSINDFFIKTTKINFVPNKYTIDFIKSSMESTNIYDVLDTIVIDSKAYKKDQMLWSSIMFYPFSMSESEKEEQRGKDIQVIEESVARLSKDIIVLTKAGEIKKRSFCYIKI